MTETAPITAAVITRTRLVLSHLLGRNQVTTPPLPWSLWESDNISWQRVSSHFTISPAVLTLSGSRGCCPNTPEDQHCPFGGFRFLSGSCPLLWDSRLLRVLPPCPSLGANMPSWEAGSGSSWLSPVLVCVLGHTAAFRRTVSLRY